jgi:3-oxoacyl-[acyl-carrier protein] reductase
VSSVETRPVAEDKRTTPQTTGCALVTGASRGIGAATAKALAEDGWSVGINYSRDRDGGHAVADSIEENGGTALAVGADVADARAADEMLSQLTDRLGPVLVLVNNAGMTADNLSMRLSDEDWSRVLDVNLTAAFRLTRAAIGPMMRQRFGRVINVSSVVGLRANPGQANYAASKAGLIALTRTVAAEVARRGVTVNAVAPGLIETELTRDYTGEGAEQNGSGALLDAIPARRTGTPEEVAACIRFLASEQAGYVTGAVLPIDGGMSA